MDVLIGFERRSLDFHLLRDVLLFIYFDYLRLFYSVYVDTPFRYFICLYILANCNEFSGSNGCL